MSYNFSFQAVNHCLPLSRNELISDIVVGRLYGDITDIWHHPGHMFITTDSGRKLFTFDCSLIHPQNGFSNTSLDVQNSPSSILDVITISHSLAVVVERNGHTQWWKYTSNSDWVHIGNLELCSLVNSNVISIAFLPTSSTLVWCEKNKKSGSETAVSTLLNPCESAQSTFSIKAKSISVSDLTTQSLREHEVLPSNTLVENCPACDVFAMASNKIFIRTKVEKDQITVTLVCSSDLDVVSMFIGQEKFDVEPLSTVSNKIDFRSLLLKHLPAIIKMELNYGDLGVKQDDGKIVALSSCGLMEVFNLIGNSKNKTTHHIIPISFEDSAVQKGSWFLHKKHIGIIYQQNICLYSIHDGTLTCKWPLDDISSIDSVIPSASPSFLAWILTPRELLGLQVTDSKLKSAYTSANDLPDDDLLESAVLQLTHLHQLKQGGYNKCISDKLEKLRQAWNEGRGSHQSQIVDMIAPLLDEYWRLDDVFKQLLDKQEQSLDNPEKISDNRFTDELTKIGGLPRRARDSRLLWLSQIYPQQLLDSLTQDITLDCEEVLESELSKWQILLGIEGWDLFRFELVCRLLFLHHPHKLYHFVKCAESVSEQTVGVSAFVRKKHSLIFYQSALECLPLAEASCNPGVAAAAQGKLILAGGGSNSIERGLKHLLKHSLWREAVNLVKGQSTDQERLASYLYITIMALAQSESLSEFIPEILELMPSWKSFLSFSQAASLQPEIRQRQLSTSASDLFCHGDSDISIGTVKPFLLELIRKMDGSF